MLRQALPRQCHEAKARALSGDAEILLQETSS
jgi:hypothetical protein